MKRALAGIIGVRKELCLSPAVMGSKRLEGITLPANGVRTSVPLEGSTVGAINGS